VSVLRVLFRVPFAVLKGLAFFILGLVMVGGALIAAAGMIR